MLWKFVLSISFTEYFIYFAYIWCTNYSISALSLTYLYFCFNRTTFLIAFGTNDCRKNEIKKANHTPKFGIYFLNNLNMNLDIFYHGLIWWIFLTFTVLFSESPILLNSCSSCQKCEINPVSTVKWFYKALYS